MGADIKQITKRFLNLESKQQELGTKLEYLASMQRRSAKRCSDMAVAFDIFSNDTERLIQTAKEDLKLASNRVTEYAINLWKSMEKERDKNKEREKEEENERER